MGRDLLARIVDVQEVDELTTDDSADEDALDALRRTGITITLV